MAIPTVIGFGTPSGSAGDATPTSHASSADGDDLWLCVEANGNQNPASVTGYTLVDSSSTGSAGSTGVSVWHRKHTGTGDDPTITDVGNHLYAVILTTRGGHATTPVHVSVDNREEVVDTSGSANGLVTSVADCLVVCVAGTAIDSTTPSWTTWANASLSDLSSTSAFEGGTDAGGGGGVAVNHGGKATAGTVSATTMVTPSEHKAFVTFAIAPAEEGGEAHELAGVAAGAGSATGALIQGHVLAGVANGVGTATGALVPAFVLAGLSNGVGTATGTLLQAHILAGVSAGVGAASGSLDVPGQEDPSGMPSSPFPLLYLLMRRRF